MSRKHAASLCIISLSPSKVKQSASSCICVEECCVLLQLMNRLHFKATRAVTENHMLCRADVGEAIIKASILEVTPILICHLRNSAGIILNDLRRGYFPSEHTKLNQKHDTTQLIRAEWQTTYTLEEQWSVRPVERRKKHPASCTI